jgi:soluble lytic murein transglycosylase
MKWLSILTPLYALTTVLGSTTVAQAQPAGDEALLQMQQAARKGDQKTLAQLLPLTQGHPLQAWAEYWELKARLANASSTEVESFLQRWQGTYQEDRLRNDWLLQLGQRRQWGEFIRLHGDFRMQDDKQLRCYDLAIATIQGTQPPDAAGQLQDLWLDRPNNDDGCTYAAGELYAAQALPESVIWQRARLSAERNQQSAARGALAIVAPQLTGQLGTIFAKPTQYLQNNLPQGTPDAAQRQLATLALVRLASTAPQEAAAQLRGRWGELLQAEERNWVWGVAGKVAARRLDDDALSYFAQVTRAADLHDDALGWMARAALRANQWQTVRTAIDAMQPATRADSTWTYWLARALQASDTRPEAQAQAEQLLRSIASVHGFYEQLALEALGQRITAPPEPTPSTPAELAQARSNPGLQRALHAIRIGLRAEGVREWNYTTNLHEPGGMDDRRLLAAATLACQEHIWDRCINTSERTRTLVSWQQRYPMPFREEVTNRAQSIGLDPAYVYGLIRQESRFIMDARSHVGASGLMQVMPATAKWTAKKIGMTDFQPHMINDHDVNIAIGTAYLKLALDDFDGSMVLAAAGYNAGPGRPRNWRNGPVLDAAIWAENVPFTETRDYVKKVLSNTTNYAASISGEPQSLRARLGQVGPKNTPVAYNRELP